PITWGHGLMSQYSMRHSARLQDESKSTNFSALHGSGRGKPSRVRPVRASASTGAERTVPSVAGTTRRDPAKNCASRSELPGPSQEKYPGRLVGRSRDFSQGFGMDRAFQRVLP